MPLLYKPDWELAQQHYLAWWNHEAFGRCALSVAAPKKDPPPVEMPPMPSTPEARWMDLDYLTAVNHYNHNRIYYGGEAFPNWNGGYPGHKQLAVFMGCPVTLSFDTGWVDPILNGDDFDVLSLKIDEDNPYLKFTEALLRRAAAESKGKSIPSIGAFGGCGDTLASLRGTDRLLYDVADRPDEVREADQYLMRLWIDLYNRLHTIIHESAGGSTCWFDLWSPGKFYAAQNDFSYMISPRMFREIFLPTIEMQTNFLDHAVYHVDGIGAFAHVDALCELPRLQAIQILPGAGKPSPIHYMDVLKMVQARGKNLHIGIGPEEVETALKELSCRGLFIQTWCGAEDEARALLKNAEKWSKDRKA